MLFRLLLAFGIIALSAYLVVFSYIFIKTGWVVLGGPLCLIIFAIALISRWPAVLVPMAFVGLINFYGVGILAAGALMLPALALSSITVKRSLRGAVLGFYRNQASLENRDSIKF